MSFYRKFRRGILHLLILIIIVLGWLYPFFGYAVLLTYAAAITCLLTYFCKYEVRFYKRMRYPFTIRIFPRK